MSVNDCYHRSDTDYDKKCTGELNIRFLIFDGKLVNPAPDGYDALVIDFPCYGTLEIVSVIIIIIIIIITLQQIRPNTAPAIRR